MVVVCCSRLHTVRPMNEVLWICSASRELRHQSRPERLHSSRWGSLGDLHNLTVLHLEKLKDKVKQMPGMGGQRPPIGTVLGVLLLAPTTAYLLSHAAAQGATDVLQTSFFASSDTAVATGRLCAVKIVAAFAFEDPVTQPLPAGSMVAAQRRSFFEILETQVEVLLHHKGRLAKCDEQIHSSAAKAPLTFKEVLQLVEGHRCNVASAWGPQACVLAGWCPDMIADLYVNGALPVLAILPPWLNKERYRSRGLPAMHRLLHCVADDILGRQAALEDNEDCRAQSESDGEEGPVLLELHATSTTHSLQPRLLAPERFQALALMLRKGQKALLEAGIEDEELLRGYVSWLEDTACIMAGDHSRGMKVLQQGRWRFDCTKLLQTFFLSRSLRSTDVLATTLQESLKLIVPPAFIDDVLESCSARLLLTVLSCSQ